MATDSAANSDSTLMNSQFCKCAVAHHLAEAFDDVGLRRDRIGADHFRPAERDGLGHRMGAFDLFQHGDALLVRLN